MHLIYLDESGNTGTNLSEPQQPVAQQKKSAREMNLGNGKGPKRTGRSSTYVAPPTSLSINFSKNFIIHAPRLLPRIRHPTTHNRLRTRRHLDQVPLFHRLSRQNLKWPECEKKFGENRGQNHCYRSQISKCFHSTNGRDLGHQHTGRGKTNSPAQTNQSPPPHRTSQGRELASRDMKTLPTQISTRRNHPKFGS